MFNSPEYSYGKTQQHVFDVYILGLKLGRLNYAIEFKNDLYSAAGNLRSTGFFSAISKYSFEASSKGKIESDLFRPNYYSEKSDTGRRKEERRAKKNRMRARTERGKQKKTSEKNIVTVSKKELTNLLIKFVKQSVEKKKL